MYITVSKVKKLAKAYNKRCSKDFLNELDHFVYDIVIRCCVQKNGCKKTLDRTVMQFVAGIITTRR